MTYKEVYDFLQKYKHGDKFLVKFEGKDECEAKLSIDDDDYYYLCQNTFAGASCDNKLGFKYSWWISPTSIDSTSIESIKEYESKSSEADEYFKREKIMVSVPDEKSYNRLIEAMHKVGWKTRNNRTTYDSSYPTQYLYDGGHGLNSFSDYQLISVDVAIGLLQEHYPEKFECGGDTIADTLEDKIAHVKEPDFRWMTTMSMCQPVLTLQKFTKSHNPKRMKLVDRLKELAKSAPQKRLDKYCRHDDGNFNADGVALILNTLLEKDKALAEAVDKQLVKLEKEDGKK